MTTHILWDVDSEVFSLGLFTLRWDTLFVLIAYLASRKLLAYIYRKEGMTQGDVATATAFFLIFSLVGARLLYVILAEPQLILTDPVEIVFPFQFNPSLQLADSFGLSIHGAAFGAFLGGWLYHRRVTIGQNYLQTLDDISPVAALTGFLLFAASSMNSEAIGKPTQLAFGTAYIQPVVKGLQNIPCCIMRNPNGANPLELVIAKKDHTVPKPDSINQGVILYLFFKPGATEQMVNEFLIGDVKSFLFDMSRYVYEPGTEPLHYSIIVARDGNYIGRIQTRAVIRFPIHLVGAISSLIIFLILFWLFRKMKNKMVGRRFAYFMICFWSIHLLLGLMKEDQTSLVSSFDVLFIVTGIAVMVFSTTRKIKTTSRLEKQETNY